jgi:hypothetical protein
MKFLYFALPLLAAASGWKDNYCLTDADAQSIVSRSIVYLEHTDKAAALAAGQSLFASNLQEFGDSINSLKGDPLGTQVEVRRILFMCGIW